MVMPTYSVYIMSSQTATIYTGMTSNLERRVWEHKHGQGSQFTARYHCDRLVYYEAFSDVRDAIAREKQIKGWRRSKKTSLIATMNPEWRDLSAGWYDPDPGNELVVDP